MTVDKIQVGDIITAYHKGYHRVLSITETIPVQKVNYGNHTLVSYVQILNSQCFQPLVLDDFKSYE